MKYETAFQRAWGRAPTRAEVASVERVCDAFEVRDNDALKAIAGLLEYYHTHLRAYPGQCTTAVQQWLGSPDGVAALGRALQTASSSRDQLSSIEANTPRPRMPNTLQAATRGRAALAPSAISGALGMLVGSILSGRPPLWVARDAADRVAIHVLDAPLGWVFLLPLLPLVYFGAAWVWRRGVDAK